jgi:hypothetical protein
MAAARIRWALPTTRVGGRPLAASAIRHVIVSLSANNGVNFTVLGNIPPSQLELTQTEIEPGDYIVRHVVVDTSGRESTPVDTRFNVAENPPGVVTNVSVTITA